MWWGYSPPLNLLNYVDESLLDDSQEPLEFLIVGAGDARHIAKTLATSCSTKRKINFHIIEPTVEQVARSILLLSICLEKDLGLQESSRYYLEVYGNTLLRPATAKYLSDRINKLWNIPTQTMNFSWLNLKNLRHREIDLLHDVFKFWSRAICDGVPIVEYWDRRIRRHLETRYDYKEGVFDWDFHMVLKDRQHRNLTLQEYKFWRNNGIAFTWLEGEPVRSNPTLLSNVVANGDGFLHYAYTDDIINGPYYTWALDECNKNKKLRATDVAEGEIMKTVHALRTNEPLCDEAIAAHRDPGIMNGVIVTELQDVGIEQESWTLEKKSKMRSHDIFWIDVPMAKVIVHSVAALNNYKNKSEYANRFDVVWLGNNMTKQLENLSPLAKKGANVIVESRKFFVDLRADGQRKFTEELKKNANDNHLRLLNNFNSETHSFAKFRKD